MRLSRKEFLESGLALAGLAVGFGLLGCSDDDDPVGGADKGGSKDTGAGKDMAATKDSGAGKDMAAKMEGGAGKDMPVAKCQKGVNSTIGTNHGHTLVVDKADVTAGKDKSYDIKGSSKHPHTVKVTAANFGDLKAGKSVSITSSSDASHTHSVTLKCA